MKEFLSFEGLAHFWGKIKELLNLKAPLKSPEFTGTPTAPTANKGTSNAQIATTKFVQTAVEQAAIDGAPDLTSYFNDVDYDSESKKIQFKHGSDVVKTLNAAPFIKDGMVDTVTIADGTVDNLGKKVLKITFNTDSGKEAIEIPLDGIFDANNYYNKTDANNKFATKEELKDYVKDEDYVAIPDSKIDELFTE